MARLAARTARPEDVDEIVALNERVFGTDEMTGWEGHHLTAHLDVFPEGQFVVELDGALVASSSSLRVPLERARAPHTWMTLTGGCELPHHDPDGDVLYGLEIMVDPEARGMGLARMLYRARKVLARRLDLWGIAIGGRIPGYADAAREEPDLTPERYVDEVASGTRKDPVLTLQLAAGFEPERLLENYVKDPRSKHHAVLMTWRT